MRRRHLVAYDIADPSRLRAVFRTMKGYGEWVQFSIFVCDLSEREVAAMEMELLDIINEHEDRVLRVELGPAERPTPFNFLGRPSLLPDRGPQIV